MNSVSCVIVPDVHGRPFWKDAKDYDCDIIFLGDYLDPYGFEGINNIQALDNFKEILEKLSFLYRSQNLLKTNFDNRSKL